MSRDYLLITTKLREALRSSSGYSVSVLSFGLFPTVLLHGAGASSFDEIAIFGGIGLAILGLIFLSWRAGRKRKNAAGWRRRRR